MKSILLIFAIELVAIAQANPLPKRIITQQSEARDFIQEVVDAIPGYLRAELAARPVELKFVQMNSAENTPLPLPSEHSPQGNSLIYGKYSNRLIQINERFLHDIKLGPLSARSFKGGHKNMYRLAKAVVIHELGHYYEQFSSSKPSNDKRFLKLSDMRVKYFTRRHEVLSKPSSPDAYEYTNASEKFAVNLEYFLLDPEYACRRPSLFQYYKELFGNDPFEKSRICKVNTQIRLHGNTTVDLDPKRIYQVDYVYVK